MIYYVINRDVYALVFAPYYFNRTMNVAEIRKVFVEAHYFLFFFVSEIFVVIHLFCANF